MFSLHHSVVAGYPNAGFDAYARYDLGGVSDFVTSRVYSPCVWAGGKRGEVYFRAACFCVLDFDETLTKQEAVEQLRGLAFLLAPTKSDGVAKGTKPARDRFRVVVPFASTIYNRDVFAWNMKLAIRKFNADPLPYDAGRIWQPSTRIETVQLRGDVLDISTDIPVEETQSYKQTKIKDYVQSRAAVHAYPKRVSRFLDGEYQEGEWNNELFFTAAFLFQAGWTVERLRKIVYEVYPSGSHEKTESTIRSAASRVGALSF